MSNTFKYFAKNAVTGLYFDGRSFSSIKPKQFDAPEIAFIKLAWANVVVEPAF